MLIVFFSLGIASLAQATNRTVEKTREAVEQASPDDWYTLAVNAEKCFRKKVNLKEAAEWLDTSLSIAERPYNLSLKGDYYKMNRLHQEALRYYVKALDAIQHNPDSGVSTESVQRKIAELKDSEG